MPFARSARSNVMQNLDSVNLAAGGTSQASLAVKDTLQSETAGHTRALIAAARLDEQKAKRPENISPESPAAEVT